jgi:hypothetical protein
MRHLKYMLPLVVLGCSSQAGTDSTEEFRWNPHHHQWTDPHVRVQQAADASASTDAGVTTPEDSGTTTNTVDSGTTNTVDSGTTNTVDSGTTNTVDSGTSTSFIPAGWLYTQSGKIYVSNGTSGTQWMGRGVNVDDIYFCGYNGSLWMTSPGTSLDTMNSGLMTSWKPTFVRISLSMNSYTQSTWSGSYKTTMTNTINALGTAGAYVLVTLRSDATMTNYGTDDATYFPTTATDSVYQALVDTFANSKFVMFGVANEPGGNALSNATLRSGMDHAVSVIRAEEDKLQVPHHLVSVQGNNWTSDISFYSQSPLTEDNVIYEVHGYPPPPSSYTYSNIPVIIGEYGTLSNPSTFFADLESKQIPSTAWDFDSYSNCAPDLLTVNQSPTNLVPTTWGSTVQQYLLAH